MALNTYIKQLEYDGVSYSGGTVVDLLSKFKIICQDFPFVRYPKPKDLPTRDWPGEDGLDIYVPDVVPLKEYDMEVIFLYVGDKTNIRTDITNFLNFIYGRSKGGSSDTVQSGRLAIYNEYVGMGRKDVVVSSVDNELYYVNDGDEDAVARIKVKFTVYDPKTEVTYTAGSSGQVGQLTF